MTTIYYVHTAYCQPLSDITNGSANCSLGDDGVPSFNDTCDITCDKGYLVSGSPTRTCLSDTSWSGTDDMCVRGTNDIIIYEVTLFDYGTARFKL